MSSEHQSISLGVVINELLREVRIRRDVYPRMVDRKTLNRKTADYRIQCMLEAIRYLEEMSSAKEKQEKP